MNYLYKGNINVLNDLPYYLINAEGNTVVKEEDIIKHICDNNGVFYMKYFMGKTYLSLNNNNGEFPLFNVLIATHEVFEVIADLETKGEQELKYEKDFFPFIIQLARIGAKKLDGQKTPLHIMEEMILQK